MSDLDLSPAFVRLARHLKQKIVDGQWAPGQLVPGEELLARKLKVSVGTVRKAFDVLSGQGLVTRQRGRGTFVARATDERAFTSFFRLVGRKDRERQLPADTLLLRKRVSANQTERAALALGADEMVYRVRRLRSLGTAPLVLETISFPAARVGNHEWGLEEGPLHLVYSFLEQQCGISVGRVEDRIGAGLLPKDASEDFRLPPGHPVLRVLRTAFDLQGRPVEFRQAWMCTDAHDYLSELRWTGAA